MTPFDQDTAMLTTFPIVQLDAHASRQVLADSPALMVVAFTFTAGGVGKLHSHPHVQSTYVQSGQFVFTVGGVDTTVGPGDSFVIPSNADHGCRCIADGQLIDTFTPRRDDFL